MDKDTILKKIEELERLKEEYQQSQQKKIDDFMLSSGLLKFINDVNIELARYDGKIDAFRSLLNE